MKVGERIWFVPFMPFDLGYFNDETCRLELIENAFGQKFTRVSGMKGEPHPEEPIGCRDAEARST